MALPSLRHLERAAGPALPLLRTPAVHDGSRLMLGRRTPEQLAAADHVRRSTARGPEAVARAKRLQAEAKAAARKTT